MRSRQLESEEPAAYNVLRCLGSVGPDRFEGLTSEHDERRGYKRSRREENRSEVPPSRLLR